MPLWHGQAMGLSLLLPRILQLGLWLLCSLAASQEICSSPGTLPAPRLFMNRLSAHPGDTVVLSCLVPSDTPMTRIVFCKDGKEISVHPKEGNKRDYDSPYTMSRESAGTFSCLYQLKDDSNQENNSLSSDTWHLHVAGNEPSGAEQNPSSEPGDCDGSPGQGPIVGFAVMAGLALVLGGFLMKTVVSRRRAHRDPGPDQSSPATEDQIQYAEVTRTRANLKAQIEDCPVQNQTPGNLTCAVSMSQQPQQDGREAVTYAVVGKGRSRVQDARPAP